MTRQFLSVFPVFSVCAIRSSVLRSPHRLRNASRSRSSRCCSVTVPACGAIAAGEDPRQLAADERVVIADAAGAPREVDAELQRRQHALRRRPESRCAAAARW